MVYDPLVWQEWHDNHWLTRQSLHWIREHAEPGDLNAIPTAIAALRADGDWLGGSQPPPTQDQNDSPPPS